MLDYLTNLLCPPVVDKFSGCHPHTKDNEPMYMIGCYLPSVVYEGKYVWATDATACFRNWEAAVYAAQHNNKNPEYPNAVYLPMNWRDLMQLLQGKQYERVYPVASAQFVFGSNYNPRALKKVLFS